MALRYKYSLIASIVCSTMVALFWGANITAVYPFIEVVFQEKTLHDWASDQIDDLKEQKIELTKEVAKHPDDPRLVKRLETTEGRIQRRTEAQRYIQTYAPNTPFATLVYILGFLAIGTFLKCLFRITSTVLVSHVSQRTVADLRKDFFRALLTDRPQKTGIGDAAGRIGGDVGAIGGALQVLFGRSIQEPLKVFACLIGAACINWRLLLFSILASPLAALLLMGLAKSIRRASHRSFAQTCQLISRMLQAFQGIQVVKAYNMESHERRRFWVHSLRVYREQLKIAWYGALVRANNELLGVGIMCLSVLAGGYLVLNQQTHLLGIPLAENPMNIGQIMTFFAFLVGCTDPLRKMGDVYGTIQGGVAAADRIMPMLEIVHYPQRFDRPKLRITSAKEDLFFENVWFHYVPNQPVLRGINLHIRFGETIAIIGPNGCGKSTLINLILRFLRPDKGEIRLGDTDIAKIRHKDWRRRISLVTQKPVLFDDTVTNNIRYGSRGASQPQVMDAARKAHAHDFIVDQLAQSYETQCGEYGGRLSGGQQQRLSLARAILRNPDLLILDEAASQIDPKSEELIRQSLREFTRGRTTIMVTHRMSTLELADRILVMEAGQILDFGTHEELLARCPYYRRLREIPLQKSA
ncbi:MAG: ABC transporter ATP-binding protein [Planctomycetales bacterium]|nr:ABC transporter ATP-binding protein [Planctomycetales bacterium]